MDANSKHRLLSLRQYGRYAFIGVFVGIATVGFREVVAYCLPADSASFYIFSIILAYAFGIVLNFLLQQLFTFRRTNDRSLRTFGRFTLVAVFGVVSTAALASLIRYGMNLDLLLGESAAAGAFIFAALLSSVLTYSLSSQFVFRHLS